MEERRIWKKRKEREVSSKGENEEKEEGKER